MELYMTLFYNLICPAVLVSLYSPHWEDVILVNTFDNCLISLFFLLLSLSYNVSLLEEWLRSKGLQAGGAVATLEPLIQAVQLLQAGKKSEADAKALVQTCTALSSQQVGLHLSVFGLIGEQCS